jgi:hypothetical protein
MMHNFPSSNWSDNVSWYIKNIYSVNLDNWMDDGKYPPNKLISYVIYWRNNDWSRPIQFDTSFLFLLDEKFTNFETDESIRFFKNSYIN